MILSQDLELRRSVCFVIITDWFFNKMVTVNYSNFKNNKLTQMIKQKGFSKALLLAVVHMAIVALEDM